MYGPEYLSDAILPFQYTDAKIVGKKTYFARLQNDDALYLRHGGNEHRYANRVCGGTLLVHMSVMKEIEFREHMGKGADTDFIKRAQAANVKIYSADPYNFIQKRSFEGHTWAIDRGDYLRSCQRVAETYSEGDVFF